MCGGPLKSCGWAIAAGAKAAIAASARKRPPDVLLMFEPLMTLQIPSCDLGEASAQLQALVGRRKRMDDPALGMGQTRLRIDAQQFVETGDEVAGVDGPVLQLLALGVRGADDPASLEASARYQGREDLSPVVAPSVPRRFPHDFRSPPELPGAPYDRAVEQSASGKILEQGGQAPVQFRQLAPHDLSGRGQIGRAHV